MLLGSINGLKIHSNNLPHPLEHYRWIRANTDLVPFNAPGTPEPYGWGDLWEMDKPWQLNLAVIHKLDDNQALQIG